VNALLCRWFIGDGSSAYRLEHRIQGEQLVLAQLGDFSTHKHQIDALHAPAMAPIEQLLGAGNPIALLALDLGAALFGGPPRRRAGIARRGVA
jgi:hypothetical protein